MQWQATNCLYAGWQNLLTGPKTIAGTDRKGWRAHWRRAERRRAPWRDAWPAFSEDPSVLPASAYRTADTPVGFAATAAADQPLGCDLGALPPTRDNWAAMAFDGFVMPPFEPITDAAAPEVPPGRRRPVPRRSARSEPAGTEPSTDLGAYLRDLQQKKLLAPRVVLLLSGAGEHPITPFHLHGCTLVLYAEPPREDAAPLTLTWDGQGSVGQEGLIEIEDGGLDLINIALKLADFPRAATPAYVLKVRGDLRLFRCRLDGPQQNVSESVPRLDCPARFGRPGRERRFGLLDQRIGAGFRPRRRADARRRRPAAVAAKRARRGRRRPAPRSRTQMAGPRRTSNVCWSNRPSPPAGRSFTWRTPAEATDAPPAEPFVVRSRACAYLNPFADKAGRGGDVGLREVGAGPRPAGLAGRGRRLRQAADIRRGAGSALPDKDEGRRPGRGCGVPTATAGPRPT